MTGYLWSDTTGWISLNCSNTGTCGISNYAITITPNGPQGRLSGYAWSDNIGWVSANNSDLAGCPSAPCAATISSSGAFTGWLKALSADNNGWDGWISLSGASYGPTQSLSTGAISGFAWGSDVVGWVDFSQAATTYRSCTPNTSICLNATTLQRTDASCNVTTITCPYAPPYGCSAGVCQTPPTPGPDGSVPGGIITTPSLVRPGSTVQVRWAVTNAASCTVSGSNGDGVWTGTSGTQTSGAITTKTTYTLNCPGLVSGFNFSATATVNIVPTFRER